MSIVNTSNNAFTYNDVDSSQKYVYVANNNNDTIQFDNISANKYISVVNNTLQSGYLMTYLLNGNSVTVTSNDTTVCSATLQSSFSTVIVEVNVPLLVNDFIKITDSDSMTVSIKVKNNTLVSYSIPLAVQPVTTLNNTFTLTNVPAGDMIITARCTLPATYIVGVNNIDGNKLMCHIVNTAICIP